MNDSLKHGQQQRNSAHRTDFITGITVRRQHDKTPDDVPQQSDTVSVQQTTTNQRHHLCRAQRLHLQLSVCQLIKLSCLPRINLWSQVRYDYDTTTTRLEYDTRKLRVCYECRWGGVRHLCDKMALNINFTNQTTNISKTNYRKQAAKRHTRRSYGLDRYVTCR